MKAREIPQELRHKIIEHDSYIEGPRWALPEGWLEKTLIEANSMLADKGWKKIDLVEVKYSKSFTQRTIVFTLRGEAYPIQLLLEWIEKAVNEYNLY